MLNVRIDQELDKKLKTYTQEHGLSKSSVVKEALVEYLSKSEKSASPFELGEGLFGLAGSGNPDASSTYKSSLKETLNAKHSH